MVGSRDIQIYSVADLGRRLKRAVEGVTPDVWVEGEVSGAKSAPSGHVYFALKDEREDAVIECVMYRSSAVRARRLIEDGARVQLRGRATIFAPRGRLQFVSDMARPAGRGALLEALENLKNRLLAEGLFAPDRKRPLPLHATLIGVVTSASGAAIHDIAKVAFRRGGVRIVLSPTLVQGPGAALRLVDAIDRLERLAGLDAIIVGRGGGSAEDLMVFNEEVVVRRIATCRVPVVSAVGHEVDVTLTDLAADARAATPSQAAEMLVPDAHAQRQALFQLRGRMLRALRGQLAEDRSALGALRVAFAHFRLTIAEQEQKLDDLGQRLEQAMVRSGARRRAETERLYRRLSARHPRAVLAGSRAALGPLQVRLKGAVRARMVGARSRLSERLASLDAMSPLAVLARGYAIATTESGKAIWAANEVAPGQKVSIRVHKGSFPARVDMGSTDAPVQDSPVEEPS
ncbi:MAG TPA: exodeoxyribonuclease VII large subunit [Polyangiaceae bacterium]|nr:exodeoxyribonuclease VII large subunit [Polyangiaceae bacterium]